MLLSEAVGPEDRARPGRGYPLKVVAEQVDNNNVEIAPLVANFFVHPRCPMYELKKQWAARSRLPPEAVDLEDANGTRLPDHATPEDLGWSMGNRDEAPSIQVYALPAFDHHAHSPRARAGRASAGA